MKKKQQKQQHKLFHLIASVGCVCMCVDSARKNGNEANNVEGSNKKREVQQRHQRARNVTKQNEMK